MWNLLASMASLFGGITSYTWCTAIFHQPPMPESVRNRKKH